jgi:hypothetical protein
MPKVSVLSSLLMSTVSLLACATGGPEREARALSPKTALMTGADACSIERDGAASFVECWSPSGESIAWMSVSPEHATVELVAPPAFVGKKLVEYWRAILRDLARPWPAVAGAISPMGDFCEELLAVIESLRPLCDAGNHTACVLKGDFVMDYLDVCVPAL